ncbi:DUF3352 domain-containing protein [Thermoflexibacter ruber]|uniref:MORN repeat variant n=1 Tax=Thermoflexibacter ruber TaxID=1003 RepID=A0A1I2IUK8_9BACT|nr:DUF3352 domain-containing protein [Thermoflexibacter ruber]SFF45338.1 MORN repeat variant [Thermoflexibacter ruber]
MRKFLFFILICLILIAGFLYFTKQLGYTRLIYFIPKDAIYILETDEPIKTWEKLSSSAVWKHLQSQATFAELTKSANSLDSLIKQNKEIFDLLGSRKVMVSAHLYKAKDYDFLFVADLQHAAVLTFLENYLGALPMQQYKYSRRTLSKFTIHELQDKASKETLHLAFVNNALIGSWKAKLVEDALTQFESPEIGKNPHFTAISEKVSERGIFRLYLQYAYLDEFMRCYMEEDNEYVQDLSETILYTGLDCNVIEDSLIQMKGYTNINDSVASYLQALAQAGKGRFSAFNVIPQRSAFSMSLGFSDFSKFFQQWKEVYQKDNPEKWAEYEADILKVESFLKISLEKNFFSWIGEEICFVQTQPKGLGRDSEIAVIITAQDIGEAKGNLDFISEQIRKRSPVKFREVEYGGFTIKYMAVKGFFRLFLGKFFEKLEKPYYTIIGEHVIFSNHPQTLKDIINDYNERKTLAKSERFDRFFEEFSSAGSIFIYCQTPVLQQTIRPLLQPTTWQAMQTNRNYIQCFDQIGFQLIGNGQIFETNLLSTFTNPVLYPEYFAKFYERNIQVVDSLIDIEAPLEIILSDLDIKKYTEKYANGKIKVEAEIKNGLKHGTYKEYYPNGEIKIKGEYYKDLQDGTWRYYDEKGKLTKKRRFKRGQELF